MTHAANGRRNDARGGGGETVVDSGGKVSLCCQLSHILLLVYLDLQNVMEVHQGLRNHFL